MVRLDENRLSLHPTSLPRREPLGSEDRKAEEPLDDENAAEQVLGHEEGRPGRRRLAPVAGALRLHLAGCRLRLFSSHRTTQCSYESISEGICSVGGVDRGRLTPDYPSKCSESRAESVPLVRTGYLPPKML